VALLRGGTECDRREHVARLWCTTAELPIPSHEPGPSFREPQSRPSPGYQYLVRFRAGATSNIIVTVRVKDVEQVFCTRQRGGAIAFADLTDPSPAFVEVAQDEVETLNPLVGAMIR
jgi:hypothetical protein